jgi:predicted O-linked N-acetylglucosamine transferase (SPINDLY family)
VINTKITELNSDIRSWNVSIRTLENEIDALEKNTSIIDESNEDLSVLNKDLDVQQKYKEELANERSVIEVAGILLKDSGIKTRIIKQYVPIMNKLINKYLAAMDFFVQFELDENFNEKIKSRFRDEFSYASFSEGEKMRIDLALMFTWRAIAKLRNSASTNLLVMDEVFDSSLDVGGTEEFLKILEGLTADTNTFIISHKGDQLFDKFHSVIKFEKHANFSRIAA